MCPVTVGGKMVHINSRIRLFLNRILLAIMAFSIFVSTPASAFAAERQAASAAAHPAPLPLSDLPPQALQLPPGVTGTLQHASSASEVTILDDRLTRPRNFPAYDVGLWDTSSNTISKELSINILSGSGLFGNYWDDCAGAEFFHPQHVVRLHDQGGRAYFVISDSKPHGGYISLVRSFENLDSNDLLAPASGLAAADYIWQDWYNSSNPIGNWNHPGKMELIGDVLVVAAQNWDSSMCSGSHMGTSDDALLFYDMRDPENPKYWGKITSVELGVKKHQQGAVGIVRIPNTGYYYLYAGGDGVYPVYIADRVSPNLADWTKISGPSLAGQHGMNFYSLQLDSPPLAANSPPPGVERIVEGDVINTCLGASTWNFECFHGAALFKEHPYDAGLGTLTSNSDPKITKWASKGSKRIDSDDPKPKNEPKATQCISKSACFPKTPFQEQVIGTQKEPLPTPMTRTTNNYAASGTGAG